MKRTGAAILWECLVREGVTDVFGYPGGAILPAYDAMLDFPIRHILVRHEQGATHMADGYARATGKVGVAIATSGPGATNMVTGIATAMMDSSPIVCITGQVGSRLIGSDAFQETDITGITLPITKHNYLVTRADDVAPAVREAFHLAASGRPGPVLIDITKDAQQTSCEFDWEAAAPRPHRPEPPPPSKAATARRARADRRRSQAAHFRRAWRPPRRRVGGVARVRRSHRHPGRDDAPRHRGAARFPSAQPGHDGHARRGLGQHRDPGGGPPHRARHEVRRSRHGQPEDLRAERQKDPRRHRRRRDQQERRGGRRDRRRSPDVLRAWLPALDARTSQSGSPASTISKAIPPFATSRTSRTTAVCTPRTSSTICGAPREEKRSSSPTSASTRCGRRSTTTMTGRGR